MLTFISTNFFKSKLLLLFTYSWATVLAKMGMSRHELHATGPAHCAIQHVECLVKPDHLVADLHQGELVQASTTSRLAESRCSLALNQVLHRLHSVMQVFVLGLQCNTSSLYRLSNKIISLRLLIFCRQAFGQPDIWQSISYFLVHPMVNL